MTWSRIRPASGALAVALLISITFLWQSGGRQRGVFIANEGAPTVTGELVVRFSPHTSTEQREALLARSGASVLRETSMPGFVVASVPAGAETEAGRALALSPVVASVETDLIRQPAAAPNDPYYPLQWHLQDIGLKDARSASDGSGVTVAIIDTGLAFEDYHDDASGKDFGQAPDLADTTFVWPYDAIANDNHPNDDYGHGTHVAGTIAENTDNHLSAAGIAPQASIMPVKVCAILQPSGLYGCPASILAEGINWAVDHGADVINISITGAQADGISEAERTALGNAASAGIVVVAAAGNGPGGVGQDLLGYPAAVESVIAVGATGVLETRSPYSNYGHGEGEKILDIVAPGGNPVEEGNSSVIMQQTYSSPTGTCVAATNFTNFPNVTPCWGTSMAAAHVTGVVALIESRFPDLTADQVRALLACSAKDLGEPGPDLEYGAGLVRADRALLDTDVDGVPDCIDPVPYTPTPTLAPPTNNCTSPSITPAPTPPSSPEPTPTPTPTESPPLTDTPVPTDTLLPTEAPTPTLPDTGSPTDTLPPTDTPTPTPTNTPSPIPTETPTPTPTPTPTLFIPECGDVDCSGSVNAADSLGVLRWLARSEPVAACIGLGYVNCDGQLNAADAATILRYSAALPLNLPAGCTIFG